jgi:hypothetical protein
VGFRSLWKGRTVCPFRNTALGADKKRRDGKRARRLSPEQLKQREVQRAAALQQRPGLVVLDFSEGKERVVRCYPLRCYPLRRSPPLENLPFFALVLRRDFSSIVAYASSARSSLTCV